MHQQRPTNLEKWAKKLTKKQVNEILRKVIGEWHVIDLPPAEMLSVWELLKDRKPFYSSTSFHVSEDRYRFQKKTFHVMRMNGSKSKVPMSIGIRTSYDWDAKMKKPRSKAEASINEVTST